MVSGRSLSDGMIVPQEYWDASYKTYRFTRMKSDDPTRLLIRKYIPVAETGKQIFELGCFPGRWLCEFGDLGYTLNGCDLTPGVERKLAEWLTEIGCNVGSLDLDSYDKYKNRKFDVVASFGFIEHFTNYMDVFDIQCGMVDVGGILIVQFPNFAGQFQKQLHEIFDIDNMNNHVLDAMNISAYMSRLPGEFEIIFSGYYGGFDFWIHDFNRRNGVLKKVSLKILKKMTKFAWKYIRNDARWSPYGALIARRIR